MDHLETISLADEYLGGRLDPSRRDDLRAHLDGCADCRAVLAAWSPEASASDLSARVMARLRPEAVRPLSLRWAAPMAALALLLTLGAFWHPERAWVLADDSYAYSPADAAAPDWGGR